MKSSAAISTSQHQVLAHHLLREDGQEDICFALWRPSIGSERRTACLHELLLPQDGERHVHGNASFESEYFLRCLQTAQAEQCGLSLLHSHPGGVDWQELSDDDWAAEAGLARQCTVVTGLSLVGATMASGGKLSARFWDVLDDGNLTRTDCESVRIVGTRLSANYNPRLRPPSPSNSRLIRTVSAWSLNVQADLVRLRVGVVGAGSVGAIVGESLARMGVEHITLIDFDTVKEINLDRLLHASESDVQANRSKVSVLQKALGQSASSGQAIIDASEFSIVEEPGFRLALDCDVLFSCVDRPWPRAALNLIAYAHLIPVIDGGIAVEAREQDGIVRADWKAHVAAPGRKCLECLGQYEPSHVTVERNGSLDDPTYIQGLPHDHALRRSENVFAFSSSVASLEVLQFLSLVVAPNGVSDVGGLNYHFVTAQLDHDDTGCKRSCPYSGPLLARGDLLDFEVTGVHHAAEQERALRSQAHLVSHSLGHRLAATVKRLRRSLTRRRSKSPKPA